jgi:hypothetical protein
MIATIIMVAAFKSTANLTNAYGYANGPTDELSPDF